MQAPISLQLYTLRDALAADFEGVIRQVAEIGYVAVEAANMYGSSPADARRLFESLGLQVSSAHMNIPVAGEEQKSLDTLAALGCKYWIVPWIPAEEFQTRDQIKAVCARLNQTNALARANGLTLLYHNHWWEFTAMPALDGKTPFDIMLSEVDSSVGFEIDTYWVRTGGSDPVAVLQQHGSRAPLLHIKDGPATTDDPMTAVGAGILDFPAIIAAGETTTEWLVVELDRCATDMLEAVRASYTYLTQNGLARGRR